MPARLRRRLLGALAVLSLAAVLGACGDDDTDRADGAGAPTTSSVDPAEGVATPAVDTPDPHARIIPVDGDLAEIVFALGLGDQVVATDLSATYPPEADAKPEIGYQRALMAEPILSFDPTIVLATDLAGPKEVVEQLSELVETVVIDAPEDLIGPAAKIRAVAAALGVPARGEVLAHATQAEIDAAVAMVPADHPELRVAGLYLRGAGVQQVFGPGSGMHVLLNAAGVVDIGERLGVDDNQPVTEEAFLLEGPEVLVVTTTGLESVGGIDGLLAMPALARTPVASTRRVIAFEDQYLLGLGPRTGQLLAELIDAFYPAP